MISHLVNKVNLKLPASNFMQARDLQQNAKRWTEHHLPILLNQILDHLNTKDEVIYIDKIEIEIPDYPWQITDEVWKENITNQILQHKNSTNALKLVIEQWLFFLKSGTFLHQSIFKKITNIEQFIVKSKSEFEDSDHKNIASVFLNNQIQKRFFAQHSKDFIVFILEEIFHINEFYAQLVYTFYYSGKIENAEQNFEIIKQLYDFVQIKNNEQVNKLLEKIQLIVDGKITKQDLIQHYHKSKIKNKNDVEIEKIEVVAPFLYCPNAGLVLLLPYFTSFFENLQLLNLKDFHDEDARKRAVYLLHFIATGRPEIEEQDLLLPKILCGYEIDEFIEIENIILDKYIHEEIYDLLNSVIDNWKVLRNTSVDALRETFLQREGRLKVEESYLLQVNSSGVDILLDKLPWGFRNHKLPWMKKNIIIEWQ